MSDPNPAFLAPHFVLVENDMDEIDIFHRDTCEIIQFDGYHDYRCGVGYQLSENGFTEATGIVEDGMYLLTPWFHGGYYIGSEFQDPDYGMEVLKLVEDVS